MLVMIVTMRARLILTITSVSRLCRTVVAVITYTRAHTHTHTHVLSAYTQVATSTHVRASDLLRPNQTAPITQWLTTAIVHLAQEPEMRVGFSRGECSLLECGVRRAPPRLAGPLSLSVSSYLRGLSSSAVSNWSHFPHGS